MDQREEGSWRERNDAFKGKVLQDVRRFLFGEWILDFFSCPAISRLALLPMIKEMVETIFQGRLSEKYFCHLPWENAKEVRETK